MGYCGCTHQRLIFIFTVPQGAPKNVTAVPHTESSIRVSWNPVPKGQRNGTISQYIVRVENGSVVRNVTVSADNLAIVIDNLEMYVTYSFQVQAFTSQGAGPFSPAINQSTVQKGRATQLRQNGIGVAHFILQFVCSQENMSQNQSKT